VRSHLRGLWTKGLRPEIRQLIADLDQTRWTGRPGHPVRTPVGPGAGGGLSAPEQPDLRGRGRALGRGLSSPTCGQSHYRGKPCPRPSIRAKPFIANLGCTSVCTSIHSSGGPPYRLPHRPGWTRHYGHGGMLQLRFSGHSSCSGLIFLLILITGSIPRSRAFRAHVSIFCFKIIDPESVIALRFF